MNRPAWPPLISWPCFILAFAIVLFVAWSIGSRSTTLALYFGYMLPIFLLSICLLLPRTHALATSLIFLAALGLLTVANSLKIAVTQLPLTTMDFYVFWSGPEGVVDVLGLPGWSSSVARPVVVVVLVAFAVLVADGLIRVRLLRPRGSFTVIIALAVSALAGLFTHNYLQRVSTLVLREGSVWEPNRAADLSRQMGVLGFLAYSYYVASGDPGDYFSSRKGAPAPSEEAILSAAASFVRPVDDPDKLLPNIVVLFAESTFNPFYSFEIETKESFPLFESTADTQGRGPLHVNTVGGGSWISEFESIVGVDARLFGYAGFYPHSALAPYIRKSLPMYLKEYGYVSSAYYAPLGSFFNARKAFLAYGFDYFYDGKDLDLPEWDAKDARIVSAVLSHAAAEPSHYPFFKYIGLVENHGAHDCIDFTTRDQFHAVFVKTDDFSLNCTLNQYLAIARSTETGFIEVVNYLKALEQQTGRPWVVLIFGDHQPHAMSMSGTTKTPFMQLIARGDERITSWHLASSLRGVVTCCGDAAPPLTMMPSLISGFVASDVAHVYLPTAFYAFQQCGSNLMGNHRSSGLLPAMFDDANDLRATFCPQYESLLTAFRHFEVLGKNVPR
jgi:phosphoglycerol transferase MdoB-like AlkP superfamily enzyme